MYCVTIKQTQTGGQGTVSHLSLCLLQVEVLAGKDCGQQGKVVAVARRLNKVVVAGLNTVCGSACTAQS